MSLIHCPTCQNVIDTDTDVDHFLYCELQDDHVLGEFEEFINDEVKESNEAE